MWYPSLADPRFWGREGTPMGFAEKANQVCLAHLTRGVQCVIDAGDDVSAPNCALYSGAPAASVDEGQRSPTRH